MCRRSIAAASDRRQHMCATASVARLFGSVCFPNFTEHAIDAAVPTSPNMSTRTHFAPCVSPDPRKKHKNNNNTYFTNFKCDNCVLFFPVSGSKDVRSVCDGLLLVLIASRLAVVATNTVAVVVVSLMSFFRISAIAGVADVLVI